jgi:hypothetical protein
MHLSLKLGEIRKKSKKGDITATHITRLRHLKKYNPWVLLPDDLFRMYWEIFITALLIYTFIMTPYRLAFSEDDTLLTIIIDEVVDFLFLLDIIIQFFSAYYEAEKYILVDKFWVSVLGL